MKSICALQIFRQERTNFLSEFKGKHSMSTIFMNWSTVKYEVHCFIILSLLYFYDNAAFFSRKYLWTFNSQSFCQFRKDGRKGIIWKRGNISAWKAYVHFKSSDQREKSFYQNWEVSIVWLLFLCIEVLWSMKCIVLLYYYSCTFMTMLLSFQGSIFGLSPPRVSVREGISVHEKHMCTSNLQTREKKLFIRIER